MEAGMFHRGFFLFRILGALLIIGLLAGAGAMLFQAGQAQGFALGAATAGKELTLPAPMPYYGYSFMYPHFFPFGMFFGIIPLVLILFLIGGIFRRFAWGRTPMGGGPHGHYPWGREHQPTQPDKPAQQPPSGEVK
jgi:hypothetical protein